MRFLRGARTAAAIGYASGDATQVVAMSPARGAATFLGPGGGIVSGAPKVNRTNLAGAKHFAPGGRSRFQIIHAAAADGIGFWTGLQHAQVKIPGKPGKTAMTLRVTEVFRKEQRAWKLIHRHADMLARPDAGK